MSLSELLMKCLFYPSCQILSLMFFCEGVGLGTEIMESVLWLDFYARAPRCPLGRGPGQQGDFSQTPGFSTLALIRKNKTRSVFAVKTCTKVVPFLSLNVALNVLLNVNGYGKPCLGFFFFFVRVWFSLPLGTALVPLVVEEAEAGVEEDLSTLLFWFSCLGEREISRSRRWWRVLDICAFFGTISFDHHVCIVLLIIFKVMIFRSQILVEQKGI